MGASLTFNNIAGSFNPCSMAFWVRVPQAAVDAQPEDPTFGDFRCFLAVIPFVTFGPQVTAIDESDKSGLFPPSYIGMSTLDRPDTTLEVNLICGRGSSNFVFTSPDYYGNSALDSSFESQGGPNLSADAWHHIMVSWRIVAQTVSGERTDVPGACTMYCFVDGENKNGHELPAMQLNGTRDPPQSHNSHTIQFSGTDEDRTSSSSGGPINGSPLSFPCAFNSRTGPTEPPSPLSPFQTIEMAEFYLYCGRVLTSASAFIDGGKPAKRKNVFKSLGTPTLCISGTHAWRSGKAQGSSKVRGTVIGEIKRYKPDPSIGG